MNNRDISLWSSCGFCVDENKIWFVPYEVSILVCYDISEGKIVRVIEMSEATASEMESLCVVKADKYVIVIPACGNRIYKYNCADEVMTSIKVADNDPRIKFIEACLVKDQIIMFPLEFDRGIMLYNYKDDYIEIMPETTNLKNVIFTWNSKQGVLFVTLDNRLYRINGDNMKIDSFEDPDENEKYQTVFETEAGATYLINSKGVLYELSNYDFGSKRIITTFGNPIVGVAYDKENIWFLPSEGLKLSRYYLKGRKFSEITIDNGYTKKNMNGFSRAYSVSDGIVFMHSYSEKLYRILNNEQIIKIDIRFADISEAIRNKLIDLRNKNNGYVKEDKVCDLISYMQYVCDRY